MLEATYPQSTPIDESQITKTPEGVFAYDDSAALSMTLQDKETADSYMDSAQWPLQWADADILLQSPRDGRNGSASLSSRSGVPRFTLSNALSSIMPRVLGGLFYDDPYFELTSRSDATQPEILDAKTAVFTTQFEQMKFKREVERGFEQMGLLGTAVWGWGWLEDEIKLPKYVRGADPQKITNDVSGLSRTIHSDKSDAFKREWTAKFIHRPFFKSIDIRYLGVDPATQFGDIQDESCKWVVYTDYLTYDDLEKLRGLEGYDIPSEEELKALFFPPAALGDADPGNQTTQFPQNLRAWIQHAMPRNTQTTADPHARSIMSLQRWDRNKVIQVLVHGSCSILIRNEANEFGKIPFFSCNWRNIPNSFYGMGLGKLIGTDQLVEEGALNAALKILGYSVKPSYIRKKGLNAPTQQIRQSLGGIIDVDDDVDKAFRIMELPKIPSEVWQAISVSRESAAQTSGANDQVVQGGTSAPGRATGMRSGTGAAAVVQANASRLDDVIERFIRQVFVPFLYQMDELNNGKLPSSTLRDILGEAEGQELAEAVDHIDFREAVMDYDVLAGAHLGAQKKMLQALPFYQTMLNSPALMEGMQQAGYEIFAPDLVRLFADLTGTRRSGIFRRMTPQKQQQAAANSPSALQAQKIKATDAASDKKFAQEQEKEQQKQLGRAASEVLRQTLEHSMQQESLEGTPSNTGLGDNA